MLNVQFGYGIQRKISGQKNKSGDSLAQTVFMAVGMWEQEQKERSLSTKVQALEDVLQRPQDERESAGEQ